LQNKYLNENKGFSLICTIDGYKQRPDSYITTQIKKYIKEHTYIDHPR